MSRFDTIHETNSDRKLRLFRKLRLLARGMLSIFSMCSTLGCVLPPPLEIIEADASLNAPPIALSASPAEFDFPGTIALTRPEERRLSLTISDNDIEDTLYMRFFVDYETNGAGPSPAYAVCIASPSGTAIRIADCPMSSICNAVNPNDNTTHVLELMIADREFLAEGDPPFRSLPPNAAWSMRSWTMTCEVEQ